MRGESLVSIGMPVYNGEEFLRQSLDSLFAQDYPHFELIISDNASQDRTEEICRGYQLRDSRVRYIRHAENQGAPCNFAFVLAEARGDYFMWAAHDDLWHPTYLRKCHAMLELHPDAVLCCTEMNFIDRDGRPSGHYPNYKNLDTLGMTPAERIHEIISLPGWFATYGLLRRKMIPSIPLGQKVYGWDVIHLLEMSLLGTFAKVPEPLFSFRILAIKTTEELRNAFKSPLPPPTALYTVLAANLMETVYQSALSSSEKAHAYADFILTFQNSFWRAVIINELLGPNKNLDDNQFAILLGMVLNRCVPLDELKNNPLSALVYKSVTESPNLIQAARSMVSPPGETGPEAQQNKFKRADSLFQLGRLDEASSLFEEALQEHETSNGWSDWATVQLVCQRIAEAERGFRRAVTLDPTNAQANLKLGIVLASVGKPKDAITCLEQGMAEMAFEERGAITELLNDCHRKLAVSGGQ